MPKINIPPAALEAGARAAYDQWRHECAVADNEPVENWREWPDLELAEQLGWIEQARAACLAMLEAWPGMKIQPGTPKIPWEWHGTPPALILPITETSTKENNNG